MRRSPFLSLDQSSDSYGKNYLAVCVKYLPENNLPEPKIKLLGIIQMGDSYTGEVIFNKILSEVLFADPIRKNYMGYASDEGSNLDSEDIGLAGRLEQEFPYSIHVKDYSHIYNLIFKAGLKEIPDETLKIVNKICSHFSRSPQKRAKLNDIQAKAGSQPLQILRYVDHRWLSMRECIECILRLWDHLKEYYTTFKPKNIPLFDKDKNYRFVFYCVS